MKVTYREYTPLDKFKWWVNCKEFTAISKWQVGGLTYFKLNEFEVKAVNTDMIIKIEF